MANTVRNRYNHCPVLNEIIRRLIKLAKLYALKKLDFGAKKPYFEWKSC